MNKSIATLLAFALTPALPMITFASDTTIAELKIDLDDDGQKDIVKIINDGKEFLLLTVELSKSGNILKNSSLLIGNRENGIWMDSPQYKLTAAENGGFIATAEVMSEEFRADIHMSYQFHSNYKKDNLELQNFIKRILGHSPMSEKDESEEIHDFQSMHVIIKHRDYEYKDGEQVPLPWTIRDDDMEGRCLGDFENLQMGLPLCSAFVAKYLWEEYQNPTQQSCPTLNGTYSCIEETGKYLNEYKLVITTGFQDKSRIYSFRRTDGGDGRFIVTDQVSHREGGNKTSYNLISASCNREHLRFAEDYYNNVGTGNGQTMLSSRNEFFYSLLDLEGKEISIREVATYYSVDHINQSRSSVQTTCKKISDRLF